MDNTKNEVHENWKKITWEWIESLVVAFIIAFGIIRPFFVQPFSIPSGSMRMTLIEGDLILPQLLRRQRERSGLSLAEAAARLGAKSRNAYARYEQGTSVPTLDKLTELLQAVAPDTFRPVESQLCEMLE